VVLGREIKMLQTAKKLMTDQVNDASKLLKALKEREQTMKERNNNKYKDVIGKLKSFFKSNIFLTHITMVESVMGKGCANLWLHHPR
jgi:hypothetical protein